MKAFFIGLQFLTRLRLVTQTEWKVEDFGKSVMYFPLVGAVIGLFLVLLYFLLHPYMNIQLLAAILVAGEFLFTGGLHADGFMDTCDGLFSGRDREKKLEIMKDSRVGSNGVVGFVFLTLLKWQLLASIPAAYMYPVLIAMPWLGRYSLVLSIRRFPYARKEGMGKAFAEYSPSNTFLGATILTCLPVIAWGSIYIGFTILSLVFNHILNSYVTKHLGGVTGDTYGFVTELTELFCLLIFVLLIGFTGME